MVIYEKLQPPATALRRFWGLVSPGTGVFTDAKGTVVGGGTIFFGTFPPVPDITAKFTFF